MNLTSIGDGAQFLTTQRHNTTLKSRLNTLAEQLSTGQIADKAQALNGNTQRLSAIDHRLTVLGTKQERNAETALTVANMQRALANVDTQRGALSETLTLISRDSPTYQIADGARQAVGTFGSLVATLNTQVGGQSLFSGKAVDGVALAPPADMLADLTAAIGGATAQADIIAAVDTWFDDPAGGFATVAYLGDTGEPLEKRLDETLSLSLDARADDPEIRATLKGAAIAAMADQLPGLSQTVKAGLLFEGGLRLQTTASDMAAVQARLGYVEGEVARVSVAQTAEASALGIARNDLVNADPFETASTLQAVQLQLETHYAMTARLSRLSLAEYLR